MSRDSDAQHQASGAADAPPETPGARLREAIVARGRTLAAFAQEANIPYRTLQTYLSDHGKPGAEHLTRLLEAGIDVSWLLTGRVGPSVTEQSALRALSGGDAEFARALQAVCLAHALMPAAERAQFAQALDLLTRSVMVPLIRSGRGLGVPVDLVDPRTLYGTLTDGDALCMETLSRAPPTHLPDAASVPVCPDSVRGEATGYLAFSAAWLQARHIDRQHCVVTVMPGVSMQPTLADGAYLLVDLSRQAAREGRVYVVTDHAGGWMVNRVVRDRNAWVLASDRRGVAPTAWRPGMALAGEVVWTSDAVETG